VVAGTSLSSTAIGMAAKMMQDMELLDTDLGKLICCAAMVDDVASLILLAMISSISDTNQGGNEAGWGPDSGTWAVLIPLLSSIAFLGSTYCIAWAMPTVFAKLQEYRAASAVKEDGMNEWWRPYYRDAIQFITAPLMLVLLVTAGFVAAAFWARTTFLLGAFMGGVCFASIPEAVAAFDEYMPPITLWTSRIFFASIGFEIPVKTLFDAKAIYFGLLLTAVAILSKVVTGIFVWEYKWEIGWAMVGRGELGFVMAEEAYEEGLTSKLTFAISVWALLIATLISPIMFRYVLKREGLEESASRKSEQGETSDQDERSHQGAEHELEEQRPRQGPVDSGGVEEGEENGERSGEDMRDNAKLHRRCVC